MKVLVVGCGVIGEATASVLEEYHGRGSVLRHDPALDYATRQEDARHCDYAIFCVGTPGAPTRGELVGEYDVSRIDGAVEEWDEKLPDDGPAFVVRSTVPVDWLRRTAGKLNRPLLTWPEFGEHWRLEEFIARPPFFVVGGETVDECKAFIERVLTWYHDLIESGETNGLLMRRRDAAWAKLATNALYAATIVISNEAKEIGARWGVRWDCVRAALDANPRLGDTHEVTERGGYGGDCLPKDVGYVSAEAVHAAKAAGGAEAGPGPLRLLRALPYANEWCRGGPPK
jgi:UDP-glucose 6-dehydrogenase